MAENRTGGGNVIGATAAARAEPHGYNFFFATTSSSPQLLLRHNFFFATAAALVTNPYTFKSLPYDALQPE